LFFKGKIIKKTLYFNSIISYNYYIELINVKGNMIMTTIEIEMFEEKVNTLVHEALTARGKKSYLLDWFKGTLFIEGIEYDDMVAVKGSIETFTDMTFTKIGNKTGEFAIDFV